MPHSGDQNLICMKDMIRQIQTYPETSKVPPASWPQRRCFIWTTQKEHRVTILGSNYETLRYSTEHDL